jgi:hypothetical protein
MVENEISPIPKTSKTAFGGGRTKNIAQLSSVDKTMKTICDFL